MALRHGSSLVPIFSMGEWMVMDNVYMPKFQKLSRDLPISNSICPVRVFLDDTKTYPNQNSVWGAICFTRRKNADSTGSYEPTEEEVASAHEEYFQRLKELFDRNKSRCGFPHHELVFSDQL